MTRPCRRLSLSRVAELKSVASQMQMLRRLVTTTALPSETVGRELERLQTKLYLISRTPKRSVL